MVKGRYLEREEALSLLQAHDLPVYTYESVPALYALAYDDADQPIGYGVITWDATAERYMLSTLFVKETARRKGYGDLLIRMLLDRVADVGLEGIYTCPPDEFFAFPMRYGFRPIPAPDGGKNWLFASLESINQLYGTCKSCAAHAEAPNA